MQDSFQDPIYMPTQQQVQDEPSPTPSDQQLPTDQQLLVVLPNFAQAEMFSGLLSARDIPNRLSSPSGLNLPGLYDVGPVEIWVPAGYTARAKQILGL